LIVCEGATDGYIEGSGGTTFGNVFITPDKRSKYTEEQWNGLLRHEYVHSVQWAASGEAGFLTGYTIAGLWGVFRWNTDWISGGHGNCQNPMCYNVYEEAAGLDEGFYTR
jgi:hypothetical protein